MLKLSTAEFLDPYLRDNFKRLNEFLAKEAVLKGDFLFFEISVPDAVTNFKYPHNLPFQPKDVLQTSLVGGTVTWNFELFDATHLNLTTSAAVTVRAFVGRYQE